LRYESRRVYRGAESTSSAVDASDGTILRRRDMLSRWDLGGIAIVAAAALVRLVDLGRRSLWFDEAWAAVALLDGPFDVAHVGNTPLVLAALIRLSTMTFGRNEIAVRLVPALLGIAAVVLAWRLGRVLAGTAGGCVAAAIVGLLPIPVYYGKEMKAYAGELCVALALAWIILHIRRAPASVRLWTALVLAVAIGSGLTPTGPLLGAGAFLVLVPTARRVPGRYVTAAAASAVIALAWLRLVFERQLAGAPELTGYWHLFFLPHGSFSTVAAAAARSAVEATTWGLGTEVPHHTDSIVRMATLPAWCMYVLIALVIAGAVRLVIRGDGWFVALTIAWHVLMASASFAGRYPYGPARIAFVFLAPTALLLASAARVIVDALPRRARPLGWIVVGLAFAWPLAGTWRDTVTAPFEREEVRPVLHEVLARRRPGDAIWVAPGAMSAFRFYVPRPDAAVVLTLPLVDESAFRSTLADAGHRGHGRVWALFGHRQAMEEMLAVGAVRGSMRVADRIAATGAAAVLLTSAAPP